jgi:3-dehydroquinate synthase
VKQEQCVKIDILDYPVFAGPEIWDEFDAFINPGLKAGGVFILTDVNTVKYCLPVLLEHVPSLNNSPLLSIPAGEASKSIEKVEEIWAWLMEGGAGRDSLLLNLGGGVVSDTGGFAAATYKRGIQHVNIPTSLIGQADAAVGGKTGINVAGVKNLVGLFTDPSAVFIFPGFLETLPLTHITSGFAEIIKSAALAGEKFWIDLNKVNGIDDAPVNQLILAAVGFKCSLIKQDPYDLSARKALNFGHTIGHALESISFLPGNMVITHGEAVAAGMICEAFLSHFLAGMPEKELDELSSVILRFFDLQPINPETAGQLINVMNHDKKNDRERVLFSLLERIGKPVLNEPAGIEDIFRSLEFYNHRIGK